MLLNNVTLVNSGNPVDIAVAGEKIAAIRNTGKKDQSDPFQIHFTVPSRFPVSSIPMTIWILIAFQFWDRRNSQIIQNGESIFTKYSKIKLKRY